LRLDLKNPLVLKKRVKMVQNRQPQKKDRLKKGKLLAACFFNLNRSQTEKKLWRFKDTHNTGGLWREIPENPTRPFVGF
jgi:hypothetical protein